MKNSLIVRTYLQALAEANLIESIEWRVVFFQSGSVLIPKQIPTIGSGAYYLIERLTLVRDLGDILFQEREMPYCGNGEDRRLLDTPVDIEVSLPAMFALAASGRSFASFDSITYSDVRDVSSTERSIMVAAGMPTWLSEVGRSYFMIKKLKA